MSFTVSQHDHPVQVELLVQWGEMDPLRCQQYRFIRYFETARSNIR